MSYQNIDIIVSTTLPTIDKLMGYKNGGDALLLYFRYVKQARIQETNTTYSNDEFMMKAMKWSKDRFYKVKKILVENKLIEAVNRYKDGKIERTFVKVNFLINKIEATDVLETLTPEKLDSGKSDTNALSNKDKALSNKDKYMYEGVSYSKQDAIDLIYNTYRPQVPMGNRRFTKAGDSKLQIRQLFDAKFTLEELMKAQINYFKTITETKYIQACQYFYSNKESGKTYRPFLDYLEDKELEEQEKVKERGNIDFSKVFNNK